MIHDKDCFCMSCQEKDNKLITTHSAYYGVKPTYYGMNIRGVDVDALDIIQALDLPFEPANALKYIIRAGKKTPERRQDIEKAIEYLKRFLDRA